MTPKNDMHERLARALFDEEASFVVCYRISRLSAVCAPEVLGHTQNTEYVRKLTGLTPMAEGTTSNSEWRIARCWAVCFGPNQDLAVINDFVSDVSDSESRARASGMAKLTEEERRALGLV